MLCGKLYCIEVSEFQPFSYNPPPYHLEQKSNRNDLKDRLREGVVFAYVGLPQNLKDLKDLSIVATRRRV